MQDYTYEPKYIPSNSLLLKLYENDLRINPSIIEEILLLPKESLVQDLENILRSTITYFEYYNAFALNHDIEFEFHLHALFLLFELKSPTSLDIILEMICQDEEFLDFWFIDLLAEDVWQFIFAFSNNRFNDLLDIVKKPNVFLYSKTAVSTALSQIAIHKSILKNEIIDWYRNLFNHYLKTEITEDDYELLGFLISDVVDFNGYELEKEIIQLYDSGKVSTYVSGSIKSVLTDLKKPLFDYQLRTFEFASDWYKYALSTFVDYFDPFQNYNTHSRFIDNLTNSLIKQQPVIQEPKIQRNESCPCGSGLKYKKCHGKNSNTSVIR